MSSNEQLSKEKENKLKDIFYLVDQDKDNKIDTNEVGVTLRALGIYLSQEDISQITKEIDPSGCGKVTYEQFKDLYITKLSQQKAPLSLQQFPPLQSRAVFTLTLRPALTVRRLGRNGKL